MCWPIFSALYRSQKKICARESGDSAMFSSFVGWLDDISLCTLNLSIRGGTNDSAAGGAGSHQP